ncbi:MAG: hypothetical protein ACK2TZ_03220 [Anaerolineales bacterium]
MMIYEHHSQPLLSRKLFLVRLLRHGALSWSLLLVSLGIGILGYHYLNNLNWIDSLLNASMILGGMGPVDKLTTDASKIFASLFAIFSGVVFLVGAGVVFPPIAHRILHRMHLDEE